MWAYRPAPYVGHMPSLSTEQTHQNSDHAYCTLRMQRAGPAYARTYSTGLARGRRVEWRVPPVAYTEHKQNVRNGRNQTYQSSHLYHDDPLSFCSLVLNISCAYAENVQGKLTPLAAGGRGGRLLAVARRGRATLCTWLAYTKHMHEILTLRFEPVEGVDGPTRCFSLISIRPA
jgi:hypothetical protein